MSSSAPTVKDLYKVITADFTAYLTESGPPQQQNIQQYLDRFVKAYQNAHTTSTPASTSAPNVANPTGATGTTASGGVHTLPHPAQRHANELWYQSLTNNTVFQHSSNLPFAFHRLSQASSVAGSPMTSQPTSQNTSASASPILSSVIGAHAPTSGPNSPATHTPSNFTTGATASPLAAQRFSVHLSTLFTQHGHGTVPIATVATRMLVYLTHLLPFLTPQVIIADWWERLIEPSLQGEIKLEKEALKTCRELVTECMIRDSLWDSATGSVLVAGDEEGQLEMSVAMAAMPIPQFVLRKYIMAAHRLNHRLDLERPEDIHPEGSAAWLRAKASRAGHGSGIGDEGTNSTWNNIFNNNTTPGLSYPQRQETASVAQELENQQKLFSKARAIIRRKKDILAKNLEVALFAYGGNVNRVKDFFSCLYTYFVGARFRAEILGLLCQFIRRQYDTSPLIVSLGLMTLIMLMPRIPAALNEKLPDLLLILSRIICWPKSRQQLMAVTNQDGANLTGQTIKSFDEFDDESTKPTAKGKDIPESSTGHPAWALNDVESEDIPLYNYGIRWRRYGPAMPGGTAEGAPDPTAIFTFLYGLFPNSLLKFLHSPREYISQAISPTGSPRQGSGTASNGEVEMVTSPDVGGVMSPKELTAATNMYIDEDLLKSRVQCLLKRHSLHPDLLSLTSEQEITNKIRWQKLEPMEIVAMCVGLDIWSAGGPFGMGPVLRSIEEDSRGTVQQDSDTDDDLTDENPHDRRPDPSTPNETHPHDIEVHSSEESDTTPMELLSQEEFFGPRAVHEPSRYSSTVFPTGNRISERSTSSHASGVHSPPRSRTKSREVRMSQILRNFTTLRGLDHDDYLTEAANKNFGTGVLLKDRRASKSSRTSEGSTILTDIPNDSQHLALIASQLNTDEDRRDPAVTTLLLLTQEYRKTIIHLERDLLMAKNELNFELFLKQQHIQQISKVHRAHVLDASVEAERQNLYNTCRSLKAQLQETKLLLEKEKFELNQRKTKQTHWDTELKNKLQTFRDERKTLNFEVERLKQDIQDTKQAQEIQERFLTEERKGTFELTNSITDLSPKLKRLEEYEKRIQEMTRQLVLWEGEQSKSVELQRHMEAVVSRWQNLELLLASEKEEARILRNRVSQQSQIIDDTRIQMAMNDGREPGSQPKIPAIEFQDAMDTTEGSVVSDGNHEDDTVSRDEEQTSGRGTLDPAPDYHNWPSEISRASSQNGLLQHRAGVMQEFMAREKERWDQELQLAHNRLSREAVKNQQLEDRILELQGQLEMARAIDVRSHPSMGGGGAGGAGLGPGGGGGGGHDVHIHGKGLDPHHQQLLHHQPSQPQDFPHTTGQFPTRHDEIDTDDGGIESTGMVGRYSRQQETEDEDDIVGARLRNAKFLPDLDAGSHFANKQPSATSSASSSSSRAKSKSRKSGKSKTKWLQPPSILERAHTDRGTYGLGSNPSLTASTSSSSTHNRRSNDSVGSSSIAARAASAGLFQPIYTRNVSHVSDAGSDMTTASDTSTTGSGAGTRRRGGSSHANDDNIPEGDETGSTSSGKKGKSKADRDRDRERDKIRLMSGMGPLVDPSKMYRNVRMF
ncbi:hypothetical protein BGZ82_010474 [Podila clonocystis]|nr:hypothetical protein BGZ82_010474 [Podila clonocystis]